VFNCRVPTNKLGDLEAVESREAANARPTAGQFTKWNAAGVRRWQLAKYSWTRGS